MNNEPDGFHDDEGDRINTELIPKPGLCITCRKNDMGGEEEILCIMTEIDQQGEGEFFVGEWFFMVKF
jgi:hypothetical protein